MIIAPLQRLVHLLDSRARHGNVWSSCQDKVACISWLMPALPLKLPQANFAACLLALGSDVQMCVQNMVQQLPAARMLGQRLIFDRPLIARYSRPFCMQQAEVHAHCFLAEVVSCEMGDMIGRTLHVAADLCIAHHLPWVCRHHQALSS